MSNCSVGEVYVLKGDKFNQSQSPKNDIEKKAMTNKPYAFVVGSLMYALVCIRHDLSFIVSVIRRYQANPSLVH